MYGYGFPSRGFTDRREILRGGSATSRTGLLLFWGIAPGMAEFLVLTGGRYGGICFLLKHLLFNLVPLLACATYILLYCGK